MTNRGRQLTSFASPPPFPGRLCLGLRRLLPCLRHWAGTAAAWRCGAVREGQAGRLAGKQVAMSSPSISPALSGSTRGDSYTPGERERRGGGGKGRGVINWAPPLRFSHGIVCSGDPWRDRNGVAEGRIGPRPVSSRGVVMGVNWDLRRARGRGPLVRRGLSPGRIGSAIAYTVLFRG